MERTADRTVARCRRLRAAHAVPRRPGEPARQPPGGRRRPHGHLVDERSHPALRDGIDAADPVSAPRHHGRTGDRADLHQQHDRAVHRRIHDRPDHAEVEPAPAHRAEHHPPRGWRPGAHRARFHGRRGVPLDVGVEHRDRRDDGPDRPRHRAAGGGACRGGRPSAIGGPHARHRLRLLRRGHDDARPAHRRTSRSYASTRSSFRRRRPSPSGNGWWSPSRSA